MKTKRKPLKRSARPAKGKAKSADTDGRADPGQLDRSKFKAFKAEVKVKKPPTAVLQQVTSTPIAHQSGKGERGVRESINGVSKTGLIRYLAHKGIDETRARRVVASLFQGMTDGVWAKNWSRGLKGDGVPDIDIDTAKAIKSVS